MVTGPTDGQLQAACRRLLQQEVVVGSSIGGPSIKSLLQRPSTSEPAARSAAATTSSGRSASGSRSASAWLMLLEHGAYLMDRALQPHPLAHIPLAASSHVAQTLLEGQLISEDEVQLSPTRPILPICHTPFFPYIRRVFFFKTGTLRFLITDAPAIGGHLLREEPLRVRLMRVRRHLLDGHFRAARSQAEPFLIGLKPVHGELSPTMPTTPTPTTLPTLTGASPIEMTTAVEDVSIPRVAGSHAFQLRRLLRSEAGREANKYKRHFLDRHLSQSPMCLLSSPLCLHLRLWRLVRSKAGCEAASLTQVSHMTAHASSPICHEGPIRPMKRTH